MQLTSFFAAALVATQASATMVGTNIGGWMVLEPWITPSFFYRFLGKTHSEGVGKDSYTVCEALGPDWGNQVMRSHWDNWLTEEIIIGLAERNVEIVRIPIGDWTTEAYGPYVGCMDGAKEKIEWALDKFAENGIKVLLDVHCLKGSQNGFDNSGIAADTHWLDETHYEHWPTQNAHWMGHFNGTEYDLVNLDHIAWGIRNVEILMEWWGHHPALYAIEPVNEPWEYNNIDVLKDFYRDVREVVRAKNPDIKFVFHESFRRKASVWNDLFPDNDMENVILDTHPYMAFWTDPDHVFDTPEGYCEAYAEELFAPETVGIKYPMWAGEWSLATDVCAHWLNGFNDYRDPYVHECAWVECPYSYMPEPYGVDFDRTLPEIGPYGVSPAQTPRYGMCATDSNNFNHADIQVLADCTLDTFDALMDAQFIWNFRTEIEDRWSYINAYDNGWLNRSAKAPTETLQ